MVHIIIDEQFIATLSFDIFKEWKIVQSIEINSIQRILSHN